MSMKHEYDETDARLEKMLGKLRTTPERNPQVAERGKAQFMAEADMLLASTPTLDQPSFLRWLKDRLAFIKLSLSQRAALASFLAVIVFIAVLFGSAGMTAYAAQSALPGDALYRVKTGLEDTRSNLTGDAARQVTLQLQFAQRRLDEIEKLIAEGRFADIQLATQEFQAHIQNTLASMKTVAAGDPLQAVELSTQISDQLTRYAVALSSMANQAPETVRGELEEALQASRSGEMVEIKPDGEVEIVGLIEQTGADVLVIGGQPIFLDAQTEIKVQLRTGQMVKVHAFRNAAGNLVAREISLADSTTDEAIGNGNSNLNGNDHSIDDAQRENANSNDAPDFSSSSDDRDNTNSTLDDRNDNEQNNANQNDNDENSDNQNGNTDDQNSNDNDDDDDGENEDENNNENENNH